MQNPVHTGERSCPAFIRESLTSHPPFLSLFHFEAHPPVPIRIPPENQYESWEPLFARGRIADALLITVLDDLHAELVSAFAPRGYHILCEKPMATSVQDCVKMVKEVELSGAGIFGIGHVLRYSPYNRAVKEVIDSGVLGEIVNIQVSDKRWMGNFEVYM